MKVFLINAVPYGSTAKIMFSLADIVKQDGGKAICTSGFSWRKCTRDNYFVTSGFLEKSFHMTLSRRGGNEGSYSTVATKHLIRRIESFSPDVIHLHNLHGWYLNLPMLFGYLKEKGLPIVWTLHDCWSFTGHCPHFDAVGCDKWISGCRECPQYSGYPECRFDNSEKMYPRKKEWFTGVPKMNIVTPSRWLAEKVKKSFLKNYPVRVINNGIDLSVFRPTESDFRAKYNIGERNVVLGVSFGWNDRKGLDVFVSLAKELGDSFRVVLVGGDDGTDSVLPENVLSIHCTENQRSLAGIYTAADVFVNPTHEDTYPTVNMEALACGTPVVTFATGGSPEIPDDTCGSVIAKGDGDAMRREIIRVCGEKPFSTEACLERAKTFDMNERFRDYIDLYEEITGERITEGRI